LDEKEAALAVRKKDLEFPIKIYKAKGIDF